MRYSYLILYCLLLLSTAIQAQYELKAPGLYNQTVYNQKNGKIYGVTYNPDDFIQYLAVVNPKTLSVEKIARLKNLPTALALSEDGNYLYLGQDSIHRYNIQSGQFDQHFGYQLPGGQIQYCSSLVVMTETDNVVAFWQGTREIVVQYRAGQRVGNFLSVGGRSNRSLTSHGKNIYYYTGDAFQPSIDQIAVKKDELLVLPDKYSYVSKSFHTIRHFNHRLYCADGTVVSILDSTRLLQVARLSNPETPMEIVPFAPNADTIYVQVIRLKEIWLQKYDADNFQLYGEELLSTINIPNPESVTRLMPLGNPYAFAVFADGKMFLVDRCHSMIQNLAPLDKQVYYTCFRDTVKITAPGNYPSENYFWSNGFRGKVFVYTSFPDNYLKLSYRVKDEQGCLSPASAAAEVKGTDLIVGAPQIQSTHNQTVICTGGFVELTAVEEDRRNDRLHQYYWSDGQVGRTIKVTKPGNYTCSVRTWQGCYVGPTRFPFRVTAVNTPQPARPTLAILGGNIGDTVFCAADSAILQTDAGYAGYRWSDGFQGNQPTRPLSLGLDSVSVQVRNAAGCFSEASEKLTWIFLDSPPKPVVLRAGTALASSSLTGNQWFLNGEIIPGATQQFLKVNEKGIYTVQVTQNTDCPSPMSEPFEFN